MSEKLNSNLVIFPRVGAFEQLFGPGRGNLNKNSPKIQMPRGLPGEWGMLKIRFAWYIIPCGELLLVVVVLNTYAKFWEEIVFFTFMFVYVLRTTTTRHMLSFIDYYFYLVANFQT